MFDQKKIETLVSCKYPPIISKRTQEKRKTNIEEIYRIIEEITNEYQLVNNEKEARLHLFTTQNDENIYIQFPGKESVLSGNKKYPFDYRPRIMLSTGEFVKDLNFADMWGLVEELDKQQHWITKSLSALFFQMGRMTLHKYVDKNNSYEIIEKGKIIATGNKAMKWFELSIDEMLMKSMNFHACDLKIDENVSISFEAFLLFFELILQNEDGKYYNRKNGLSSGRVPTSDTMLLLASTLFGKMRLSVLLQRFVSGFGVAKCSVDEINPATDGLISIVDRKKDIVDFLSKNSIEYKTSANIIVNKKSYRVVIKTKTPKVAIVDGLDEQQKTL